MNKNRKTASLAFGLIMLLISLGLLLNHTIEGSKSFLSVALPLVGSFLVYRAIKDDKLGIPTNFDLLNPEDTYEVISVFPEWDCLVIINRSSRRPEGEPILIEEKGFPRKMRHPGAKFIPSKVPDDLHICLL